MAKTLKQIADELGVPKYRLYRFLKQENILATYQEGNRMYYDETIEEIIKFTFKSKVMLQEDSLTLQSSEKTLQEGSATLQSSETLQEGSVTLQPPEKDVARGFFNITIV